MRHFGLLLLFACLTACSTYQPVNGTAIDDATVAMHQGIANNQALADRNGPRSPSVVSRALMPDLKIRSPRNHVSQRRFNIAVKDEPARNFYMGLVTGTPVSIIVSPEIKGNISLNLKHVTVEQVLQTLEDVYGYTYNTIPGGYEIVPNRLQSKIYSVNYLEMQRKGTSDMSLSSGEINRSNSQNNNQAQATAGVLGTGGATEGSIGSVESKSNVDFWRQLQLTLRTMIGKEGGRSVTVNPLAGVVVVRAMPKELKQVEAYLDLVQNSMDRQVILEAKIIEVNLSNEYQMGIDWKVFGAHLSALSGFIPGGVTSRQFPNDFNRIRVKWTDDFSTTIQALENQGNVQVLSSPRVATMNNQKSLIKVGNDEFFVTNISQNTNYLQTNTGAITNPTQNVNLTPFFSGITLDVTPQIDVHGDVTLHVHPSVSLVKDQRKTIDLGQQGGILNLPLANSTIRESDTIVHAKNGQVVIIGGLMQNQTDEDIAQLPFFGNIPFLGTIFRDTKQTSKKSELVILLKPTVLNKINNNRAIYDSTQRMAGVKRGFHFGSRPDVFGDEGEEPVPFGPKAGKYSKAR